MLYNDAVIVMGLVTRRSCHVADFGVMESLDDSLIEAASMEQRN